MGSGTDYLSPLTTRHTSVTTGGIPLLSSLVFTNTTSASENTRLHGSPFMDRPHPFPRAHKREASGGKSGTKYSPQSVLERMRDRARMNCCLLGKTEPSKRVSDPVTHTSTLALCGLHDVTQPVAPLSPLLLPPTLPVWLHVAQHELCH